jgi:hypothetical protein
MFIQTEETPNPATLKFIPDGHVILKNGTAEFKNQKQAETKSPLALQLFAITGVEAVFFGHDFITITKSGNAVWKYLTTEVQAVIMDFFLTGKNPMFENQENANAKEVSETSSEGDSEIVKQIKELIEIKVRPAVAMDGGDIIFHSFETYESKQNRKKVYSLIQLQSILKQSGFEITKTTFSCGKNGVRAQEWTSNAITLLSQSNYLYKVIGLIYGLLAFIPILIFNLLQHN